MKNIRGDEMTVALSRLTELDAVNYMLSTIAESPVSTLEDSMHEDAMLAQSVLTEASREVQDEGWYFNREHNYPLYPDENGNITLAPNMTSVDIEATTTPGNNDIDVVARGNRLYDNTNHTYKFDRAIHATVKWVLPFEELPETAKNHIVAVAARQFQAKAMGSETLHSFTGESVGRTRAALVREEVNNADGVFNGLPYKNARRGYDTINNILRRRI
jgi:hypothetical protein